MISKLSLRLSAEDKISVKITPFDSEAYGKPTYIAKRYKNISPIINEHTNFKFDGKTYTYQVNATDPDEDILTYSLKSAPAGMAIDPKTGAIRWNVPPDVKGKLFLLFLLLTAMAVRQHKALPLR